MKTVDKLINANYDMRLGNHRVESNGSVRKFIYFATAIFVVDDQRKIFYTDNGGWETVSTKKAINCYRREFTHYTEVTKEEFTAQKVTA